MNIVLLTDEDKTASGSFLLSDERAEHIIKVLKSKTGDVIEIGFYNGDLGKAVIENISDGKVELKTIRTFPKVSNTPLIHLVCALPRPQTLKKILFHSASMGVNRIDFIKANRVEKSYYQSHLLKKEYYEKLIKLGMTQGKQTTPPEVFFHGKFKAFFEDVLPLSEGGNNLKLLAENSAEKTLFDVYTAPAKQVTIAIGPEGGWIPYEINFMREHGFVLFKLSKWTLRVEAAVISAVSQVELLTGRLIK